MENTKKPDMKEQVKQLWRQCFHDSDEFVELYFRLRYDEQVNLAHTEDDEVTAALQMLLYPMTFFGRKIPVSYISGACTRPDKRGQGLMRSLLDEAHRRMMNDEILLSNLIPAEPRLFDYYARSGYAPVFRRRKETFQASVDTCLPDGFSLTDRYNEAELFAFLDRRLRQRMCYMQHTPDDLTAVVANLHLSQGAIYTLLYYSTPVAVAWAYPNEEGGLLIAECVATAEQYRRMLLQAVCQQHHLPALTLLSAPDTPDSGEPYGMARIISAEPLLRLYAASHPDLSFSFRLEDNVLPQNNGTYHLVQGECDVDKEAETSDLPLLTPATLTALLFADSPAGISLMLDI